MCICSIPDSFRPPFVLKTSIDLFCVGKGDNQGETRPAKLVLIMYSERGVFSVSCNTCRSWSCARCNFDIKLISFLVSSVHHLDERVVRNGTDVGCFTESSFRRLVRILFPRVAYRREGQVVSARSSSTLHEILSCVKRRFSRPLMGLVVGDLSQTRTLLLETGRRQNG